MIAVETLLLLILGAAPEQPRFVAEVRAAPPDGKVDLTICGNVVTFTYPEPMPPVIIKDTRWPRPVPVLDRPCGDRQIGIAYIDHDGAGVLRIHAPEDWRHLTGRSGQVSLGYDTMSPRSDAVRLYRPGRSVGMTLRSAIEAAYFSIAPRDVLERMLKAYGIER